MNIKSRIDFILSRLTTRAFSVLAALSMVSTGIFMCFKDLKTTGKINIKAAFVDGQVETGSLGLASMFLGVIVILILNHRSEPYRSEPYKGQEIEININGNNITAKGLSYRKLKEIVAIASVNSAATEKHNKQLNKSGGTDVPPTAG